MPKPLLVHPEARLEAQEAYDYLADRSPQAASQFAAEIRSAYDAIEGQPDRFPTYLNSGCRYRLLNRFSYLVIYEEEPEQTVVYAVAHSSRKPDYWKDRLR